jgi:hypothetical protein
MFMMKKLTLLFVTFALTLVACGGQPPQASEPAADAAIQATSAASPLPYLEPQVSASVYSPYPAPGSTPAPSAPPVAVVPFHLNRPIPVGATEVSGTGPAGVPILIADVTGYGEILAEGIIQPDGTFTIALPYPIEANHRIGLSLNDLAGTGWTEDSFSDPGFIGEEFKLVPMVGVYYDSVLVEEK